MSEQAPQRNEQVIPPVLTRGEFPGARATEVPSPAALSVGIADIIAYSLPALPLSFMGGLVSMYLLKFATDVLLVAPAVVATAFALAKVWDGVSDPIVGYLSDRTRRSAGRRRPWVLAATPPMLLGFAALWVPPSSLSDSGLAVWICGSLFFYYTAYTIANVPHLAWGAELSRDYHERSRVFGARGVAGFVGLLVGAGAMALLQSAEDERAMAARIALAFAALGGATLVVGTLRTPERPQYSGRGAKTPLQAMADVANNRLARILLAVFYLESLSISCLATLFPYVTDYLTGGGQLSAHYFAGALAAALIFCPIWIPLSRRFGKRNPWIFANVLKASAFAGLFFAGPDTPWLIAPMAVLIGIGHGCTIVLPASIKADVIDVDELATGERKEGAYFAGWNLAEKLAAGTAIALAGFFLQLSGYEANATQGESTLLAIRGLFSALPLTLHLIAIGLLLRFDLDEAEHTRVRGILDARNAGGPRVSS